MVLFTKRAASVEPFIEMMEWRNASANRLIREQTRTSMPPTAKLGMTWSKCGFEFIAMALVELEANAGCIQSRLGTAGTNADRSFEIYRLGI